MVSGIGKGSPVEGLPLLAGGQQVTTEDFLQLLTLQLRYQSPFEPMKETEFVTQLAQFSELEAARNLQALLSRSLEQEPQVRLIAQAASLLGKYVVVHPAGEAGSVKGVVERVVLSEGVPSVVINGQAYALQDVVEIRETAAP